MDDAALKAAAEAARTFTVVLDSRAQNPIEVDLRIPTPFAIEILALESEVDSGATAQAQFVRAMLEKAIVGWRGLTAQDIVPATQCADPHAFSAAAVETLLNSRNDFAVRLRAELVRRINESGERVAEAKKS